MSTKCVFQNYNIYFFFVNYILTERTWLTDLRIKYYLMADSKLCMVILVIALEHPKTSNKVRFFFILI